MKKFYLILTLFILVIGALNAAPIKDSLSSLKKEIEMGGCDPPIINADSLLLEYYTNQPLSARGGVPPYTYTFSPSISSSELISPPDSTITYTIIVTGANGCDTTCYAHYVPLLAGSRGACDAIFISQYIQDTVNHDIALELYNPTNSSISLSNYYLFGTTGSLLSVPFFIYLHGTIAAHKTFLVVNTSAADTSLTHKANMFSDSLNFGGEDIVTLAKAVISPPTLTVTFLDEVGTIYPLPTDSGWAVGSGSTKNHTLARQTSVTQGSVVWSTCKNEWNVYPRGYFSLIGHYSNICTPTDPNINLYMQSFGRDCNSTPAYANFAVIAQSDPPTVFNNCIIDISYHGGEFAGDSLANGGVIITRGASFQPDTNNDYNVFDSADVSPGVAKITLGSVSDTSADGAIIPTYGGDTLFYISLRIQNSCETGAVRFTDYFNTDTAYFAEVTKIFDHIDSTYAGVDSIGHNCDSNCCGGYDSLGNCLGWCYKICYDTFSVYTYDSIFTVTGYHNEHYTGIIYSDDSAWSTPCPMQINPINTSVNAGTNDFSQPPNTSILYITGAGFGATRGNVWVTDANAPPGICELDTVDILSWSENVIRIKMPSYLINFPNSTPGTGPMKVYNACGESTSTNLFIKYNIYNDYHNGGTPIEKARSVIVMSTATNSLVFWCDTSVVHNAKAYACVKKAVREWNCYTGVNWKVGPDTAFEGARADGASVIYFSHADTEFLAPGVLMKTYRQGEVDDYCYNYVDSIDFYNEADIAMRLQKNLQPGTHWSYDTLYRNATRDSFYFYDYILHELGHAMGLGHINDSLSLMYYNEPAGVRDSITGGSYNPGPGTLFGAYDMINTSISIDPYYEGHCTDTTLVIVNKGCVDLSMSVPDIPDNPFSLNLYPNPISYGDLTITYTLANPSDIGFRIFDCTGRLIMNLGSNNKAAGTYSEQVNTATLAQGIYLFTAIINGEYKTIKFVKL